ncbi:MAG: energy transducer TonB [Chitinophagaceae bacterium]|nr:energy transducer TonB [Chitinophagaceae bacterium]
MKLKKSSYSILLFLAFFANMVAAQVPPPPGEEAGDSLKENVIFNKVEIEAQFPGGDKAWLNFLVKNLDGDIAVKNGAPAGNYMVVIQFVVNKEGEVTDIKALTNYGYGMEQEVIRLLKKSPKWSPAIQDGRKVKAYRKQPVTFQVVEERKSKRKNRS